MFGVAAGLAAFVCFGVLIDFPAWVKPWVLLLLILVLLAWIVNVVLTTVLRCARGCAAWAVQAVQPPCAAVAVARRLPSAGCRRALREACGPPPCRVGNDVCVNLESKATQLVADHVSLGGTGVLRAAEQEGRGWRHHPSTLWQRSFR